VLLVAAAASGYFWLHQEQSGPTAAARATRRPVPVATPQSEATPTPTPGPAAPTPPQTERPVATATATPPPRAAAAEPEPAPTPVPTPTPAPVAQATPTPEPHETSVAPAEPASLTAVSPLSVRRGGRVMLDIRGSGLRSDQHVLILPLKEVPRGITVIRQKWTSPSLVTVLLELDAGVTPAAYAIALETASGERTNPLHLTVTK